MKTNPPPGPLESSADNRERLRRLVSDACDGVLSAERMDEIEALLEETPELVADYSHYLATESALETSCGLTVFDDKGVGVRLGSDGAAGKVPKPSGSSTSSRSTVMRNPAWALAAAVLAVVTGVVLWAQPPLATVVAASDAILADGRDITLGQDLGRDWINLERGVLRVALHDGAMMAVEAPARLRVVNDNSAELAYGAASVYVPQPAHGFALLSPQGRIVDLGTGFRAVSAKDAGLSVHVTQGAVRLEAASGESLDLQAGHLAQIDETGRLERRPASRRKPRVTGQFRFQDKHPKSLGYRAFTHDGVAYAFLESHAVRLQDDLRLDVGSPGRHNNFDADRSFIPKGTLVDCYLLHCAPERNRHEVKGSIEFGGKIVGILCNDDRLNATNEVIGAGWTLACQHAERGVESAPDPNSDIVTISGDRHRLTAQFRTMSIDQIRILVTNE